jgi:alkylation response protein AidB-like acyl-CoA dehydrogenase
MSVELNELRDSVRQVVSAGKHYGAGQSLWDQAVELGWLMVSIPESLDGLGMSAAASATVSLELGRGLCAAPLASALLSVDAICGSALNDKSTLLTEIVSGGLITLPMANTSIKLNGSNLVGHAIALEASKQATQVLLWTENHQLLVLVALDQPGIKSVERSTRDKTRELFDVELQALNLTNQIVLAEGEQAQQLISMLLARRDIALAADSIGAAAELLKITIEHLNTRVQFSRPLAMFQALKHRCSDLKVQIAAADALLFDALARPFSETRAMAAKQLSCTTFAKVAEESLQLHGGIGMADEHACHLFLKRSLLNMHLGRGEAVYAEAVAKGVLEEQQ